MRQSAIRIASASFAVCAAYCGHLSTVTGDRGNAVFEYSECVTRPESRCSYVEDPIPAGGAQVSIVVSSASGCGSGYAFASAASSDSTIFTAAKADDGTVLVTSGVPGTAKLQLLDSSGGILDEVPLNVVAVATINIAAPPSSTPPVMLENQPQTFHIHRFSADGSELVGNAGFSVAVPNGFTALPPSSFNRGSHRFLGAPLTIQGTAGSAGALVASVDALSATQTISSISISDVTSVSIVQSTMGEYGGHVLRAIDSAGATASGGLVYGAPCAWSTEDAAVHAISDPALDNDNFFFVEDGPYRRAWFTASGAGEHVLRCSIGSVEKEVTIQGD